MIIRRATGKDHFLHSPIFIKRDIERDVTVEIMMTQNTAVDIIPGITVTDTVTNDVSTGIGDAIQAAPHQLG